VHPVLFENDLLGVVEIGAVSQLTTLHHELLKQIINNVGVFISTVVARSRAEHLLALSEAQSKVLKQRENELKEANAEMKHKTSLAEQANRTKSEFLANMSHELRTPLNSLLILAESLSINRDGNLTEQEEMAASIIYQSGSDLLALINDILDLAKVEAGKMVLNNEPFLINDMMENIKNQFAHVAEDKGLYFGIDISESMPDEMFGDRQRIEQVIKNFLSNAFKFTNKGSVTLSISKVSDASRNSDFDINDGGGIDIEVRDTGIGIPHEKLSKIFNAFEQVDGSTSREYGGTGLGLRISEELVMLLGGVVSVESEAGSGSSFMMTIPLNAQAIDEDQAPEKLTPQWNEIVQMDSATPLAEESPSNSDCTIAEQGNKMILIVEDDEHFSAILEASIRKVDIACLVAGTGKIALELANKYLPTAIIMDIGLPDISGIEVFSELKNNSATSHIPVYFMSVHDEMDNSELASAAGYLTKPISQTQLDEALSTLMSVSDCDRRVVLIVDDDTVTQDFLAPIFEQKGFDVDFAASSEEALTYLEEGVYCGMLLDLMLPGMSGLELLDHISNSELIKQPPVVVYSAKDMGEQERQALEQYTNAFVAKNGRSSSKVLNDLLAEFDCITNVGRRDKSVSEGGGFDSEIIRKTSSGIVKDELLKGKNVLIVDDDTRNIFALSLILKQVGMTVTMADNGERALEILEESGPYDIVLMDIMMPVMNGYEAIERIREQTRYSDLPVIAVTAKAMAEDREHCIKIGASDYLAKPVEATELFHLMRKNLIDGDVAEIIECEKETC